MAQQFRSFEVNLPESISEQIIDIKSDYESFEYLTAIGEVNLFGSEETTTSNFNIQVSNFSNRIHITGNGISLGFRNLGLGCKLYRKMLSEFDYISSEDDSLSANGKMIWNSMRQNEMFYTFYTPIRGYAFSSDKPAQEILTVLCNKTKTQNSFLWDDDFLEENRELILSSEMTKFIS